MKEGDVMEETNIMSMDDIGEEVSEGGTDFPWVLFSIEDVIYGVFSAHVLSIEILGVSTPLVNSPEYIRGITDFRGDMISLIDFRTLFNLPDRYKELERQMDQYISAHKNWISTLEECVRERKHFTLPLDPHKCTFGKWFYSYKTSNSILEMHLKKIETPHATIHQTAGRIVELMKTEQYDEIDRLMNDVVRPNCDETISLLEGISAAYASGTRDMIVVLEVEGVVKGIIVDKIVSVEYINRILDMEELDKKTEFIRCLGKREKDNSTVQIINESKVIQL